MNGCELCGQMKQTGLPLYVLPPDGASAVNYLQLLSGKTTARIYTNLSCLLFSSSGGVKALRKCSGDAVINLRSLIEAFKRKHNSTAHTATSTHGVTGKAKCDVCLYLFNNSRMFQCVDHQISLVGTYHLSSNPNHGPPAEVESLDLYSGHGGKASFTMPNDCWVNNCKIHLHYAAACPTR